MKMWVWERREEEDDVINKENDSSMRMDQSWKRIVKWKVLTFTFLDLKTSRANYRLLREI